MKITKNLTTRLTNLDTQLEELNAVLRSDRFNKEARIQLSQVNAKLNRMIDKYGKIEKVNASSVNACMPLRLSLKYPKDGMGRLHLNDNKGTHVYASGCGYDKRGTVLGKWLNETFKEEVANFNKFTARKYYGINVLPSRTFVDGGCGENCVIRIIEALGFKVTTLYNESARNPYVNGYLIEYVK